MKNETIVGGRLLRRLFWTIFNFLVLAFILAGACALGVFYYYGSGLPNYQELKNYKPAVITRLYSSDGRLFAEYATQKRIYVPINAIPKKVVNAFLAAEDKTFYTHFGLDLSGIARAAVSNLSRLGQSRRPVGASTITQQVAKNFLLSEISNSVSIERKIKEAILAIRIENAYAKNYILELYLNEIYLGSGAYGVAAAALHYFDKSLEELNTAEIAFIAALPKAPSRYNPLKHAERAIGRRNYVITRMFEDGHISKEEALEAIHSQIVLKKHADEVVQADFFAEEVRRELLHKFGEHVLYKEGLVVRTTLEPTVQKYARDALRTGLINYDKRHGYRGVLAHITLPLQKRDFDQKKDLWVEALKKVLKPAGAESWRLAYVLDLQKDKAIIGLEDGVIGSIRLEDLKWARKHIHENAMGPAITHPKSVFKVGDVILVENGEQEGDQKRYSLCQVPEASGAIVVMDPQSGNVLAMQGGFSFSMSQFNRASQAKRQPGSSFKPFVYLAALEKGLTPSTILHDEPFEINLGYGLGVWRPQNYNNDFLGPVTLRRALELSRNLATIDIVHRKTGMHCVTEIARRFGIVEDMKPQLAMVLGAAESTLLRMTRAYSMIANGGKFIEATLLDRIQDRNGRTILADQGVHCSGCDASTLQLGEIPHLVYGSKQVADPASVYQVISIMEGVIQRGTGKKLSVLTMPIAGKTGTSNEYRDAWFFAFTPNLVAGVYIGFDAPKSLGKHEGGTRAASPILLDFMGKALKQYPEIPFKIPSGVKLVQVNATSGRPGSGEGQMILEAFKLEDELSFSDAASVSEVEETESGEHLESGDTLHDENRSAMIQDGPNTNARRREPNAENGPKIHGTDSESSSTDGIY
jgi:penicillin-binding protein 1A